jgi:hypothetical protein
MSSNNAQNVSHRIYSLKRVFFWCIRMVCWGLLTIILAVIGLIMFGPSLPPSSVGLSYPEVMLVSENKHAYLEAETENWGMKLYYTQLGGWFECDKQTLLYSQTDFNTSSKILFEKMGITTFSPFKVIIPGNTKGEGGGCFMFYPPATYQQAQLIKIDPALTKRPAN